MKKKTKGRLILVVLIGIGIYLGFIFYSNWGEVVRSLNLFELYYLPVILALVFIDYCLRALRWDYYLKRISVNLSKKESFLVFFSGLSMAITPGKLGELIKPVILDDKHDIDISKTVPVVLIERFTDIIGMMFLAFLGLLVFQYGLKILFAGLGIIIAILVIIQSKSLSLKILEKIAKIPYVGRFAGGLEESYNTAYSLLRPKSLSIATLLSFSAWGIECFCLFLIFQGLNVEIGVLSTVFIFAFSTIAGVITMLPGGLGVTEGSIVGLSMMKGAELANATASTILIRLSTLWFGVIIGFFVINYVFTSMERNENE